MITFSSGDHLYVAVVIGFILKGSTTFRQIAKSVHDTKKVGNHCFS